ncbi:hypothetical protein ACI65C_011444, partial [Semiaphis heraclei]
CYIGTINMINIFKIINICFLGFSSEFRFTFHYLMIETRISLCLYADDSIIECKLCHSFILDLFLIVNFYLLKATFK